MKTRKINPVEALEKRKWLRIPMEAAGIDTAFAGAIITDDLRMTGDANWFINGYLHDITLPLGNYFAMLSVCKFSRENKWFPALYSFLACSTLEVAQKFGLYHGTFDPYDFLAYATGVGLAIAANKGVEKLAVSLEDRRIKTRKTELEGVLYKC